MILRCLIEAPWGTTFSGIIQFKSQFEQNREEEQRLSSDPSLPNAAN
jgi:hypothetical protein